MKHLIAMTAILFSFSSLANNKIFLSYCSAFGDGVPFSYSSCVNNNFRTIGNELDGAFFSYCSNYGNEVSYGFTSCITRNFQEVERKLNNEVYLSYCTNFSRTKLDFGFTSCVNNNYRAIERALQKDNQ